VQKIDKMPAAHAYGAKIMKKIDKTKYFTLVIDVKDKNAFDLELELNKLFNDDKNFHLVSVVNWPCKHTKSWLLLIYEKL